MHDDLPIVPIGNCSLDLRRGRLLIGEADVPLRPKAFAVLTHLARNPGRIVPKDELMASVWGDVSVSDDALVQCLKDVRRALGESHGVVRTIRGRGYLLDVTLTQVPATDPVTKWSGEIAQGTERSAAAAVPARPGADGVASVEADVAASVVPGAPVAEAESLPRVPGRRAGVLWATLACSAVLAGLWWSRPPPPIRSIAILPLRPLVQDQGSEALEFGVADTLIARLSPLARVRVVPLSAVRRYARPDRDAVAAGRELGVEAVLDATVHTSPGVLRVTARLVRVTDGHVLWSQQIDQGDGGALAVQDAMTERVLASLGAELSGDVPSRATMPETRVAAAYDALLLGRYLFDRRSPDDLWRAIEQFDLAVTLDGQYARAWAALADTASVCQVFGLAAPSVLAPRAREAATRAVDLAPNLPAALSAAGHVKVQFDWDWAGARAAYERAIAIDPSDAGVRQRFAHFLAQQGDAPGALAQIERAIVLEPLSMTQLTSRGIVLLMSGRYADAEAQFRKTLAFEPDYRIARHFLSLALTGQRRWEAALDEAGEDGVFSPLSPRWLRGYLEGRLGHTARARGLLDELLRLRADQYVPALDVAAVYAGLGEADHVFEWLDRGVSERSNRLDWLVVNPVFADYRDDERFRAIVRRVDPGAQTAMLLSSNRAEPAGATGTRLATSDPPRP